MSLNFRRCQFTCLKKISLNCARSLLTLFLFIFLPTTRNNVTALAAPSNPPHTNQPFYFYSPNIEEAIKKLRNSATAQYYIDYIRQNHITITFGKVFDIIEPPAGGGMTQDNTITFTADLQTKPIPPSLLIHEIVHVIQNYTQGEPGGGTFTPPPIGGISVPPIPCSCSLLRERKAYAVQFVVIFELGLPDPWFDWATDHYTDVEAAAGPNGYYQAASWTDAQYKTWIKTLWPGGEYNGFSIR